MTRRTSLYTRCNPGTTLSDHSDTLMSSLPVVPRELMSICDCATPSALNGYTLWILN